MCVWGVCVCVSYLRHHDLIDPLGRNNDLLSFLVSRTPSVNLCVANRPQIVGGPSVRFMKCSMSASISSRYIGTPSAVRTPLGVYFRT